jgi:hypothetical protein
MSSTVQHVVLLQPAAPTTWSAWPRQKPEISGVIPRLQKNYPDFVNGRTILISGRIV